jgi:hypothetical protein
VRPFISQIENNLLLPAIDDPFEQDEEMFSACLEESKVNIESIHRSLNNYDRLKE